MKEMKKFDVIEMKMVIDCKNKDEKMRLFFDRGKLPQIHQDVM
jgi:hypothetical protein